MTDQTVRGFARAHGVSAGLISRIISGKKPANSGRSAELRRKLEELAR